MKLGIMQPYLFPYIGYFQLMNAVDKWVVFDDIQYIRHGWVNRNRVLSPNLEKEWQYITVPLVKHQKTELIYNIVINNTEKWQSNIYNKLSYYKKIRAPYFKDVIKVVENCLSYDTKFLNDLNIKSLKLVANYLGINFNYVISSKEEFDYSEVNNSGDWAFEISKQMDASTYVNPVGGKEIFDNEKFENEGIELKFLKSNNMHYKQSRRNYVPWLSIIDVMMFNPPERIKDMLNKTKESTCRI